MTDETDSHLSDPEDADNGHNETESESPNADNVVHIDDITADGDEATDSKKTGMTLSRYRQIQKLIDNGTDGELTAEDRAAYDRERERMTALSKRVMGELNAMNGITAKTFLQPYEQISKQLKDSMAWNLGIQESLVESLKPFAGIESDSIPRIPESISKSQTAPDILNSFDYSEQNKRLEKANEKRRQREKEDRQVAADHLQATQLLVQTMAEQAVDSANMAKHQKKMNWWILGATIGSLLAAVIFGIIGMLSK